MYYKLRPGIVRTHICGAYLLIPTREASETCPNIRRIGLLLSATLEVLEKGRPLEDAYTIYRILTKKTEEEIREKVDGQLAELCREGYLLPV